MLATIAVQAMVVSYEELLESSSSMSNKLKVFKSDELIEGTNLENVYAQYYPTLALSYNTEYNRDLNGFASGSESIGDTVITNGTRFQSSLSLNLNYELYHFGTTQKSVSIVEKEIDIKRLNWCQEEKKLHQNILDRYSSAIKSNVRSSLKKQMLELRYKLYKIKQRLYKAGKYSKVDLGDEAITIIDLERDIELAVLQYQEDIKVLSNLSHIEINEKETELLGIGVNLKTPTLGSFEETAIGQKYSTQIEQKEKELSRLISSQLPSLSMYGNYYVYGSDTHNLTDAFDSMRKNSWKMGLSVRFNIFEGFKYNNDSQKLKYELTRIKHERDLTAREYDYNSKIKQNKIFHLDALQSKDQDLYEKTTQKIKMIKRLIKSHEIDKASELNALLESLERELNLKIEENEAAYERASLEIEYRGVAQCTQH